MSCCDLNFQPLAFELLQHFGCHAFKLCTKFEWNRVIRRWVIDDLARFRREILGVGRFCPTVLRVRGPNFSKLGKDIRRSFLHKKFFYSVRISCCIFKRGSSKLSDVENDAKFRTFWPLWKLGEGGRDLYTNCWSFTYDRTPEIHLMVIHCAAAERGGLIKRKKESSWIKFKAFPTNVGRPNDVINSTYHRSIS